MQLITTDIMDTVHVVINIYHIISEIYSAPITKKT